MKNIGSYLFAVVFVIFLANALGLVGKSYAWNMLTNCRSDGDNDFDDNCTVIHSQNIVVGIRALPTTFPCWWWHCPHRIPPCCRNSHLMIACPKIPCRL